MEYARLYRKYRSDMLIYAYACSEDVTIAQDIVQQVFLKLLEKGIHQGINNWKAYLMTMVRNESVNHLRKVKLHRQKVKELESYQHCLTPHDLLLEKEYRQNILKRIAALPPKQCIIYELHYVYSWQGSKVAAVMDISASSVKRHLLTIRKNLEKVVA